MGKHRISGDSLEIIYSVPRPATGQENIVDASMTQLELHLVLICHPSPAHQEY